ncbi:alpha/beta hydrolase [Microbacterium schleiferi]|uniref:alpha/beta fold hydrolase n=1 Tax=Microbacterium schleiferi TaxID=69362 RepID=UPI00311FFDCA
MSLRIVLVHGAATTPAVWDALLAALQRRGLEDVEAVRRPCSGTLDTELSFVAERSEGALVVGQSGGATLALGLAGIAAPVAGVLCHEPAVGSLVPGLLGPVSAAYAAGGVAAFGAALYGPTWSLADAGGDTDAVARELPMFRGFEPSAPSLAAAATLVTVGTLSPSIRHDAAKALHDRFGYPWTLVPGSGHFVAREAPEAFADAIARHAANLAAADTGGTPAPPQRRPLAP